MCEWLLSDALRKSDALGKIAMDVSGVLSNWQ